MDQGLMNTQLTRHPLGSARELIELSLPLILSLFTASFMGFCNRLFLAHHSFGALEASVSAVYLCTLFQNPCIRITSVVQVFSGLFSGANQLQRVGPYVWQMIWFSLFSMAITLPLSGLVAPFVFGGTAIREQATSYFFTLMSVNFLFPLAAALSSFFIGRGKTRIILLSTLFTYALNILLDYMLIFGVSRFIPPLGIFGAALANAISQGIFCVILFYFFLRREEREVCGTGNYVFHWGSFWEQIRFGLPRAIARILVLTAWVFTARIMTLKGGDYLMVLSVGGSLILLFTFINDGLCQGMITIASHAIGARQYEAVWKLMRSALLILLMMSVIIGIPYLLFPQWTLRCFFPNSLSPESLALLKRSCFWLWVFFCAYGFNAIGFSLITAARDVYFYLIAMCFIWCTTYFPAYYAFNYWNWPPDTLWLIMAMDSLIFGCLFLLRSRREKWKAHQVVENHFLN